MSASRTNAAANTPENEPVVEAADEATKIVVWKLGSDNHAKIVEPAYHGVSQSYRFDRDNNHTVEMSAADADALMATADKGEFRVKK